MYTVVSLLLVHGYWKLQQYFRSFRKLAKVFKVFVKI